MLKRTVWLLSACVVLAVPVMAQSPNTSTVVVFVVDQSGAVVKDLHDPCHQAGVCR